MSGTPDKRLPYIIATTKLMFFMRTKPVISFAWLLIDIYSVERRIIANKNIRTCRESIVVFAMCVCVYVVFVTLCHAISRIESFTIFLCTLTHILINQFDQSGSGKKNKYSTQLNVSRWVFHSILLMRSHCNLVWSWCCLPHLMIMTYSARYVTLQAICSKNTHTNTARRTHTWNFRNNIV